MFPPARRSLEIQPALSKRAVKKTAEKTILQSVNPLEHPDWDAPLTRRPDFSFFHGLAWTKVLVETYGYQPMWQADGEALLPLMEVDSWLTGRRGVALPFTDNCEPLGVSAENVQPLFQQAIELGKSRGWKTVELRGGQKVVADAPASLAFYGHRLDLTIGEQGLFENMDGSIRQGVRKAEKDGVSVEISQTVEAIREFYGLQCQTRQRHGLPPQPFQFFQNIWRHILSQNQGMVALARHGGETVAGAVYFFLGGRAIYKFGASDFRWQQLRPNNLVMWTAIRWLAQHGCGSLHLGKTSLLNDGLRRFKLNLGAAEERIEYVKFDLRANRFMVETDGVMGWHNRVFRSLPVFLSRRAGELLYRHWA
jgi:hypothetical protein